MDNVDHYYQMLYDCYRLCGWEFDAELNILRTNSASRYLHSVLLLGKGRREALLERAQSHCVPLIVSDSIGLMWGCVFGGEAHGGSTYILGSIFTGDISVQVAEKLLEPLNLSIKNKWAMNECMQQIPNISTVVFFQQVIMLHYYITGEAVRISDFAYYTSRQEAASKKKRNEFEEKIAMPHSPLINEKMLLDMVRTGNLEFHSALANAGAASPGIRTRSSDPIRQAKYSVVAFTALCTRAAIEGGLSSESAYSLCDTYTESVDNCTTISQIAAVSHTMYEDFIRRVNQCRRESGVTRPIRICCDYIDTHPTDELKLETLAEKTGYTEYYLTRKFKNEMGMSVNAYIRKARIHYAKVLLTTTNVSIQEISEHLHFCSRSYFADIFQKAEGISPSDYRSQNQKE